MTEKSTSRKAATRVKRVKPKAVLTQTSVAKAASRNGKQIIRLAKQIDSRGNGLHLPVTGATQPCGDVMGCSPLRQGERRKRLIWNVEDGAAPNYRKLGNGLAATGGLYRNGTDGHGLVQVLPDGTFRLITTGAHLAPLIVDRVPMCVTKDGKIVRELPTAGHLNAMLRSEEFLSKFQPVDEVTKLPVYLDDFSLVRPGYNDCGPGKRILHLGGEPQIVRSMDTINAFLGKNVMPFATNADRTNTVAAALTVLFRRQWLGEKPLILITATQSHAGKGTITDFLRGTVPKADVLYEAKDWPMYVQLQMQTRKNPEIGVIVFDNVRLDSAGGRNKFIRSAFLESFVTNAEVTLASPGAGELVHLRNKYVVTLNSNDGAMSPDLMNRSLPILLAPVGDIQDRVSPIGNPKLEFLPQNRDRIEAELRGMIEKWKEAGRPLDGTVRHPMSPWARTIGGILKVNGLEDFLANYGARKSADDPVREALGILGAAKPGKELKPLEWAKLAVELGLARTLFSPTERDTEKGRQRAIGCLLKRNCKIKFDAQTDTKRYRLLLEGGYRRWEKKANGHVRYVFTVLQQEDIPVDETPLTKVT
jgi:hypothetical protein